MEATASLTELLKQIEDPRTARGKRHPLHALLGLAVVAMLSGMNSYAAIVQFGKERGWEFLQHLGFTTRWGLCKATYSRVFRRIDVEAFEAIVALWIESRIDPEKTTHLALDGKTLRGSRDDESSAAHLVAAYAVQCSAVLAQLRVDSKTNEHKAALELLGVLPLQGRVVTGDAMFTHRDVCSQITESGGDYLLIVKDNQPNLVSDIKSAFTEPDEGLSPRQTQVRASCCDEVIAVDKGHGRREKRTLRTTTWMAEYLSSDWPGCRQVMEIRRERRIGEKVSIEVVYGITSLSREKADAARLLSLNRAHWGIENGLHHRRDVTLREDASRIRKGGAGQVMAILRNLILFLLPRVGKPSLTEAIRYYICHPQCALEAVSRRL